MDEIIILSYGESLFVNTNNAMIPDIITASLKYSSIMRNTVDDGDSLTYQEVFENGVLIKDDRNHS